MAISELVGKGLYSATEVAHIYWLSGKQWNKLLLLEKNLAVLEWTQEILQHAESAIREVQKTGKGSAWSIKYVANNRRRLLVQEKLT